MTLKLKNSDGANFGMPKRSCKMSLLSENVGMYRKKTPENVRLSTICGFRHPPGILKHILIDLGELLNTKINGIFILAINKLNMKLKMPFILNNIKRIYLGISLTKNVKLVHRKLKNIVD